MYGKILLWIKGVFKKLLLIFLINYKKVTVEYHLPGIVRFCLTSGFQLEVLSNPVGFIIIIRGAPKEIAWFIHRSVTESGFLRP